MAPDSKRKSRGAPKAQPEPIRGELAREVALLRGEVEKLNANRFVNLIDSPWRLMLHRFLSGMMIGLGTVLGASILVSILAYFLAQIELLPIIGDWASQVLEQIETERSR